MARCQIMLLAAAIVLFAFAASPASAELIDGPGTYYGFDLPEPFYNYWNYTSDIKDMSAAMAKNDFVDAADIWNNGRNGRRSETVMRTWLAGATADRTGEACPPLNGEGAFAGACCGERAGAVEIYNRLWLVMYAQHEVDAGVRDSAAGESAIQEDAMQAVRMDEATHGFAVVASPVDQAFNYWEWIEGYSTKACLRKRRDRVTKNFYAATNIAYRDGFSAMFDALNVEMPPPDASAIDAAQKALADQVMVQFMTVMLVEARLTVYSPPSSANACNAACLRPSHKAAVDAAWKALGPLVHRSSDKASIAAVDRLLATTPGKKWLARKQALLKTHLARIAASFDINFKKDVYNCRI
ncbi:hypothetical protein COO60DRAFT_1676505 [Scenedesmus sp. NREL 46B-D3]|nr:hypothetical protein COO60DRAFT_1676505 [Scenedesmus sp. NREL 46B-D3]